MSLYDYQKSKEIATEEPSFVSLIMATAWKADILNFGKIRLAFPKIIEELEKIYFRGDKLKYPWAISEKKLAGVCLRCIFSPSLTILISRGQGVFTDPLPTITVKR